MDPVTRFGLQIPSFTYPGEGDRAGEAPAGLFEQVAAIATTAESAGFDSLWVMDHLFQIPMAGALDEPMFGQWCPLFGAVLFFGAVWAFGVVWLLGVVLLGDEAAMATAPHVPAAATATVADAASSMRLDFSNRSPFSGLPGTGIVAAGREDWLRA